MAMTKIYAGLHKNTKYNGGNYKNENENINKIQVDLHAGSFVVITREQNACLLQLLIMDVVK